MGDFVDVDMIVFPIHHPGHWLVGIVRCKTKRFEIYNSLQASNDARDFKIIENHLKLAWSLTKPSSPPLEMDLGWVHTFMPCPQQEDTEACGVFVIWFVEHLARRAEVADVTFDRIGYFRRQAALAIARGELGGV
jgi:Ulp1 family protease